MDVLSSRLERLKQQRFDQRIALSGNELDILKNEIRLDLLVCGGSLDVVVSVLYWLMASNTVPPLTVIFIGFLLLTLYNFHSTENHQAVEGQSEDSSLCNRIQDALQVYLQLLVWPKVFFHWYFSIREEHSSFFYIISGGFFVWLYQVGNTISGAMAIYLLLLVYVTFPMVGMWVCFDWMLLIRGHGKDNTVPSEESLLPETTEENEKLWELSVSDEVEEKNIIEEFQPSFSGLQLGSEFKANDDDESSIGLDLQLDQTCIPDVNDSDSSSSSFDGQNMNFSIHHFSSSGSDDTTDNITSKLEDASKETVNIPPSKNTSSKSSSTQRGVSLSGRDSDEEEGLDVESFEVISREEFNL